MLKNSVVGAMGQVGQLRFQCQAIVRQPRTGAAATHTGNMPVDPLLLAVKCEKRRLMQPCLEVQVCACADQFKFKGIRRADGFIAREGQHLKLMVGALDAQAKTVVTG